jgi:hypothetical protein
VIWAYLELFGSARASRLVFVDQSPTMIFDPVWDQDTIDAAGALFSDQQLRSLCRGLADPEARPRVVRDVATRMVSPGQPALVDQLVTTALRVDGDFAAALLFNHAHQAADRPDRYGEHLEEAAERSGRRVQRAVEILGIVSPAGKGPILPGVQAHG